MNNPMIRRQDPILAALQAVSDAPHSKIKSIDTNLFDSAGEELPALRRNAFYLATENVKFRHAGITEAIPEATPPSLCLNDLTGSKYRNKILVYYSSSGSGKTAELVGSSASRGAHLALVLTIEPLEEAVTDLIKNNVDAIVAEKDRITEELRAPGSQSDPSPEKPLTDKEFVWRERNKLYADHAILPTLECLLKYSYNGIRSVVEAAKTSNQPLKLVLAVDEASSCPKIVRGILRFPDYLKRCVHDAMAHCGIELSSKELEVMVSIGGTGVASSTMGSLPQNFLVESPFHHKHWAKVVQSSLATEDLTVAVSWHSQKITLNSVDLIEKHFPVLAQLMQNGRLASIAVAELRKYHARHDEIKEAVVVNAVIEKFIESNGMSSLSNHPESQRSVAASALAVHLFQDMVKKVTVPKSGKKVEEWATEMDFFPLSTNWFVVQLVRDYGLLEPADRLSDILVRGKEITAPLKMTLPQQLVATHMLGLSVRNMLDPTWFGFELMSTHFVKCALAASIAVRAEDRPSVKATLECIGFSVDPIATSEDVKETWQKLGHLFAYAAPPIGEPTKYTNSTCQSNVGLKIVTCGNGKEVLQIEANLLSALMTSMPVIRSDFTAPIASINEGNSDLCDGIVTFYASKDGGRTAEKVSIMNQAKDYADGSTLNVLELNKHATKMKNSILDGAFGELRLLCVGTCHSKLMAQGPVTYKREYLPFEFHRGLLLKTLLRKLREQRSVSARVTRFAVHCNKHGAVVDLEAEINLQAEISRKRKCEE